MHASFQNISTIATTSLSVFFPLPDYIIIPNWILLLGRTATVRHNAQPNYDVRQV